MNSCVLWFALLCISLACVYSQSTANMDPEITINGVLTKRIIRKMKISEKRAKEQFEKKMLSFYENYKQKSKLPQSTFQSINITDFAAPGNANILQQSMRDIFEQFSIDFNSVLSSTEQKATKKQNIAPGTSFRFPATSCRQILFHSKGQASAPNGLYWINPNSPVTSSLDTSQQNCFMAYGGYSLISKIGKNVTNEQVYAIEKFCFLRFFVQTADPFVQ